MKKILITGISGFIGHYLHKYKPDDVQLTGSYFNNKVELVGVDFLKLDLEQVDAFISHNEQKYDVVIHCAAESSLAVCENNPHKAFLLNSEATEKLARWSAEQNSKFIYLSTDIVFDGKKGDYYEDDNPQPINIYGKSKLEAERSIIKIHKNVIIVRLALCLGKGLGGTNSFINWFLERLENEEKIPLYYDEFRTPVSTKFVAQSIWEFASNNFTGIIHLTGKEKISRYKLGQKMLEYLKSDKQHLLHKESSNKSTYPRPRDVSMKSKFLEQILNIEPENTTTFIENIL
jgi:dTDP-4-dehydrorhamnose reductase